ncbi:helix-turn-helix domain-containing protein [Paenibacillus humicola]|uniref:helix-turn-helix domain-containing protein n=1 Tax=Paenibacillus humicola TaxID=3110540 RepID=UPI00237C286E|nr:helix-turn-helix domain-containing protein [Paenibacillus humicola]
MFRLNRYQTKLLLFSTCVSTLPILVLGILFYLKFSESIQDKVNEGNRHILEQTRLRVEQVLQGVDLSLQRLVDNDDVLKAMNRDLSPAEFQLTMGLASDLNQVQRFDFGLQDVDLIGLRKGWILSNYGLQRVSAITNKTRISQYVNISANSYWSTDPSSLARNISSPGERTVSLVKKIPAISDDPDGLLVAEFSTRELYRLISQNNSLGEIFIFDGEHRLLTKQNQQSEYPAAAVVSAISRLNPADGASGSVPAVLGKLKVGIEYQKSAYNQWLYVSVVPVEEIRKEAWRTSWIILALCLGFLFLANLFAIQFTRRLYSPVRRLYELCFSSAGRSHDGRMNEFDAISENITHMRDLQIQMTQQIHGQVRQLEELFVLKLVQGEFPPPDIDGKLAMMVYRPPAGIKWMSVLVLQIDTVEGTRFAEKDRELLLFAINNIVGDIIPAKMSLLPIIARDDQVTVVHTDDESAERFQAFLDAMTDKIAKEVRRYLELSVSIGVSRAYPQLKDAVQAYGEAKEALKHRLLSAEKAVIRYGDIRHEDTSRTTEFPEETEKRLIQAIRYAETEEIDPLIDRLFQEMASQSASYIDYQASFVRLIADLVKLLQDAGLSFHAVYGESSPPLQQLFELHTVDEIRHWFKCKLIQPLVPLFEQRRQTKFERLSQEIVRMIQTEYDTDITLETCASRLHYHPAYISRVLKNEIGMTFSEYLAHYRLNVAKSMLEQSDAKIAEIAEKLRYNNSQNFIRYFRKMVGMTPGAYRELCMKQPARLE